MSVMEGSESTYEECGYVPSYITLSQSAIYLNDISEKQNKTLPTDDIMKQNSNPVVDNVSVKSAKYLFLCKTIVGFISGIMVLAVIMAISFTYSRPISYAEKEAGFTVNRLNIEFDTDNSKHPFVKIPPSKSLLPNLTTARQPKIAKGNKKKSKKLTAIRKPRIAKGNQKKRRVDAHKRVTRRKTKLKSKKNTRKGTKRIDQARYRLTPGRTCEFGFTNYWWENILLGQCEKNCNHYNFCKKG